MIYNEDCLEGMKRIADGSVDMILTDLPYNLTDCSWDKAAIDLPTMWKQFYRVAKKNAAMALFANGKFLIELATSNFKDYRYKWVWHKNLATGFLNAKKMPLKCHEDILIFYRSLPIYNPQWGKGKPYRFTHPTGSENYQCKYGEVVRESDGKRYPIDLLECMQVTNFSNEIKAHPTQKPVPLL
ncbi:MAG: site-specific DNA-methyltransferase [Selenomonadaceae bacterium]|nr:site-specific DNA-methyltransferase [Selenomonadaceae bacterium]